VKIIIILLSLLTLSISLNYALYSELSKTYKNQLKVQLDPAGQNLHLKDNSTMIGQVDSHKKKIILFGDSRIAMWSPLPNNKTIEIIKRGRHGETSSMSLLRLDHDVIPLKPDTVIIQTGINDLKAIGFFPHKAHKIIKNTQQNILNLVTRLKQENINIELMTILPPGEFGLFRKIYGTKGIRKSVTEVNNYIKTLQGDGIRVVDMEAIYHSNGTMPSRYRKDDLHINREGYMTLNSSIEKILQQPR